MIDLLHARSPFTADPRVMGIKLMRTELCPFDASWITSNTCQTNVRNRFGKLLLDSSYWAKRGCWPAKSWWQSPKDMWAKLLIIFVIWSTSSPHPYQHHLSLFIHLLRRRRLRRRLSHAREFNESFFAAATTTCSLACSLSLINAIM